MSKGACTLHPSTPSSKVPVLSTYTILNFEMEVEDSHTPTPDDDLSDSEDLWLEKCQTAYRVYQDLWNDFYTWQLKYCTETISSLSKPIIPLDYIPLHPHASASYESTKEDEYGEWFSIQDWDPVSSTQSDTMVFSKTIMADGSGSFGPYPRYSSCTPSSINFSYAEDVCGAAPFIPFADNVEFKIKQFLENFREVGWQTRLFDPDRWYHISLFECLLICFLDEIIVLEVARRLHYTHEFSYADIDKLRIFHKPLRSGDRQGLLWDTSQRYGLFLWAMLPLNGLMAETHRRGRRLG